MRTCLCRSATRPRETNAGAWLGHGTHPGGLGVHDARDTLCPKPAQRALRSGAQLCVSSISPPAIRARRGGAVRSCWASSRSRRAIVPHAMALRQRRARACTGCACGRAAPPPMAQRHEPAGAVMRPARRSTVRGACMPPERGRCVAHRRSTGTRAPQIGGAAPGVLLVSYRGRLSNV